MNNYVQMTQRNIPSKMELIRLHSLLNDELEKFQKLLLKTKEISITEFNQLEHEQKTILQTIQDINKCIQSMASSRKTKKQLH